MRKCLTVSTVIPWHFGQAGDSDLRIQKRWWFSPMCPERSWNSKEACRRSRSAASREYFLDGAELLIDCSKFSLSELFHRLCHLLFSLLRLSCRSAEMLSGSFLWSNGGRNLASLEDPCVASLASSSARSLGPKLQWPGTQWICKLTTPFEFPFH